VRKLIILWAFFVLCGASCTVVAGEYVLVEGQDIEVCREYGKNLNSFKNLPHAMVCERLINPEMKDFSKPQWKPLDVWEKRDMLKQIDLYLWYKGTENKFNYEKWLGRLKERVQDKSVALSETFIDIDNDGKAEHVLRYDYGKCDPKKASDFTRPTGRRIVVWKDKQNELDENLNRFLGLRLGIFTYKDRVFHDHFGGSIGFKEGTLTVFDSIVHSGGWTELGVATCTYNYRK
jgi:hypothetical protein